MIKTEEKKKKEKKRRRKLTQRSLSVPTPYRQEFCLPNFRIFSWFCDGCPHGKLEFTSYLTTNIALESRRYKFSFCIEVGFLFFYFLGWNIAEALHFSFPVFMYCMEKSLKWSSHFRSVVREWNVNIYLCLLLNGRNFVFVVDYSLAI